MYGKEVEDMLIDAEGAERYAVEMYVISLKYTVLSPTSNTSVPYIANKSIGEMH